MISFIKENKFAATVVGFVVLVVVASALFSPKNGVMHGGGYSNAGYGGSATDAVVPRGMQINTESAAPAAYGAPTSQAVQMGGGSSDNGSAPVDRMVVQESNLSFVVNDVKGTGEQILSYTKGIGGFMVNSEFNNPSEAPYAQITVRVPSERFDEALAHFKALAIKVSSENLTGYDVTDQYKDYDASLKTLTTTKAKFEGIMAKATDINDILNIQQNIIDLQSQIDQLTGARLALADSAKFTKVTMFLSTDELSLPYAPDTTNSPGVVFKQAVRSLVQTLRSLEALFIWVFVYGAIWGPLLLLCVLLIMRKRRRLRSPPNLNVQ